MELKATIADLTERLTKVEASQNHQSIQQSEAYERIEAVEDNLCSLAAEQLTLSTDQTNMMLRLEAQQQYSRKQTLLVTGDAVKMPEQGEDTRKYVLRLLNIHLGITDLAVQDITACHRLKNKKVILVRFLDQTDSDRVYRARYKPKQRGLILFESVTQERISILNNLKELKAEPNTPILSYFTQAGTILVRTSPDRDVRAIEIPFGLTKGQIMDLCAGGKVAPTPVSVREHFRSVHGGIPQGSTTANSWNTAGSKRGKRGRYSHRGPTGAEGRPNNDQAPPTHQRSGSDSSDGTDAQPH